MPFWCCGHKNVNNLDDDDDAKIKPYSANEIELDIDDEKSKAQKEFKKQNVSASSADHDTTESTKDGSVSNMPPEHFSRSVQDEKSICEKVGAERSICERVPINAVDDTNRSYSYNNTRMNTNSSDILNSQSSSGGKLEHVGNYAICFHYCEYRCGQFGNDG